MDDYILKQDMRKLKKNNSFSVLKMQTLVNSNLYDSPHIYIFISGESTVPPPIHCCLEKRDCGFFLKHLNQQQLKAAVDATF